MKLFFILSLIVMTIDARVITFSPLPMDKANKLFLQYEDMLKYLEKETGYEFKFVYSPTYKKLLKNFQDGKIDIVEMGALPYLRLKEKFKFAKPFLTFNSSNGKSYYTCNLLTTEKDINKFDDIKQSNKAILTRSLSTCGYLMTEFMMQKHHKTLQKFDYKYAGTHTNVLLELLLKENTVGVVKSTVYEKYKHFNFKILERSPHITGFSFIANENTISKNKIKLISDALLKLKPMQNKKDKELVSKWSSNTKYGSIKTKENAYNLLNEAMKEIKIPKVAK